MEKKYIAIRFSDSYFQSAYTTEKATQILIEKQHLFVKYLKLNVKHFNNAFTDANSICLMQPKESLQNCLNEMQKELKYKLPNAQELWCDIMMRITNMSIEKAEEKQIEVGGIVISVPDHLDVSLREMIMTSIEYCEKMYQQEKDEMFKIKVISNAFSAALYSIEVTFHESSTNRKTCLHEISVICMIEHNLNETQWSVVLSRNKNGIILKTGYIQLGAYEIYKELMKKLCPDSEDEEYQLYKLQQLERNCLIENIKKTNSFCSKPGSLSFKNIDSDNVQISKDEFMGKVKGKMQMIVDEIKKTIDEVNEYLETVDFIEIGSERIDFKEIQNRPKVFEYCIDEGEKNYFLRKCLQDEFEDEMKELSINQTSIIVLEGSSNFAQIIEKENVGKCKIDSVIVELIEEDRFSLSLNRNDRRIEMLKFPKEKKSMENSIEIGNLEEGNEYFIFDNKTEYPIGKFTPLKNGQYDLELNDYLSSWIPFGRRIDRNEKMINCSNSVFINFKGKEFEKKNPISKTLIETKKVSKRVEIIPITHESNYQLEEIKRVKELTDQLPQQQQKILSYKSKIDKEKKQLKGFNDQNLRKEINSAANEIKKLDDYEEMESQWKQFKEEWIKNHEN